MGNRQPIRSGKYECQPNKKLFDCHFRTDVDGCASQLKFDHPWCRALRTLFKLSVSENNKPLL